MKIPVQNCGPERHMTVMEITTRSKTLENRYRISRLPPGLFPYRVRVMDTAVAKQRQSGSQWLCYFKVCSPGVGVG